jgi:hypothetical protein
MMIDDIKSYAITKLAPPLISLGVAIATFAAISALHYSYQRSYANEKIEMAKINGQITTLNSQIKTNNNAFVIWQKFQAQKTLQDKNEGLQIEASKKIIEDLRLAYKINNLEIKLSTPVSNPDYNGNKFVSVEEAQVSMSFGAFSDEYIFGFLNDLLLKLPGMLQVIDFNYSSPDLIDDNLLNSLRNGVDQEIVSAKLELLWRDFKDIKKAAGDSK